MLFLYDFQIKKKLLNRKWNLLTREKRELGSVVVKGNEKKRPGATKKKIPSETPTRRTKDAQERQTAAESLRTILRFIHKKVKWLDEEKKKKKNRKHSRIFSAHEPSAYSSEQNKQTTIQRIFKKITKTKGLKAERQDCFFVFIWCALSLHFAHFGFGDAHQKNIAFVTFSLLGFFLVRKQERVFFFVWRKSWKKRFATQLRESWSS